MSELVYTLFGYGKIETSILKNEKDTVASKEQSKPEIVEQISQASDELKTQIDQVTPHDPIVKVTLKWGGIAYLPVRSPMTLGKHYQEKYQTESEDLLRPQKGLRYRVTRQRRDCNPLQRTDKVDRD